MMRILSFDKLRGSVATAPRKVKTVSARLPTNLPLDHTERRIVLSGQGKTGMRGFMKEDEIIAEIRQQTKFHKSSTLWLGGGLTVFILAAGFFIHSINSDRTTSSQKKEHSITCDSIFSDLNKGDVEAAYADCQLMLTKMPFHPDLHKELGWIYLLKNEPKLALAEYKKACDLFPSQEHRNELDAIKARFPRALAAATNLTAGTMLVFDDLGSLTFFDARPPRGYFEPNEIEQLLGHKLINAMTNRQVITAQDVETPRAVPSLGDVKK